MRRRKPIRQINLRINEELRRKLEGAAEERRISINELMRQLLEESLENRNKAKQSLEDRVRRLESLVQRSESPLPLLEAERRQREQEEGGNT
jgi:ribosome recycling factor